VPLVSGEKPILALGRHGLGKTAVWTADFAGDWSAAWRDWPETGKLVAQVIRWLSGAGPEVELAGRIRLAGNPGAPEFRIDGPGLTVLQAGSGRDLAAEAAGPGQSRVRFPAGKPGELQRWVLRRADGRTLPIGTLRGYDDEFLPGTGPRPAPLSTEELHARLDSPARIRAARADLAPWFLAAAALLLPFDVALRRLSR
jgi:hypothetical protein